MSDNTDNTITITNLTREYNNHTITLSPNDLKFHVSGPEFEKLKPEYCTFPSFEDARAKIDTDVQAAQRLAAKNIKFNSSLLSEEGEIILITGINRNTSMINNDLGRSLYPNVSWLQNDLLRKKEIKKELNQIEERISKFAISNQRGYGRMSADEYPLKLVKLQETINEQTERAIDATPKDNVIEIKTNQI
jgi:hypothetical protein